MNLFEEFFAIAREFDLHQIPYCVIGGIAMAFHDEPRFTKDIDLLVLPEELPRIRESLERLEFLLSAEPWTFQNTALTLHRFLKAEGEEYVTLDLLVCSEERHRMIIERASSEAWSAGRVKVADPQDIIWMKEQRGSDQDKVDIRRLRRDTD